MKIKIDPGSYLPERAHDDDAGLDLRTTEDVMLWPGMSHCFDTGVHMAIPKGYLGKIESKSGLNVKHGVVSCGGVVDAGYTGSIVVKLYNLGEKGYLFKAGEKIAQIVIQPCIAPELEIVSYLDDTERGDCGFGSSGR